MPNAGTMIYHYTCNICNYEWDADNWVNTRCSQCKYGDLNVCVYTLIRWPGALCGAGHDRLMQRLSEEQKKGNTKTFKYWVLWLKEEAAFTCSDCKRPTCKGHAFRRKPVLELCVTCKETQEHHDEGGEGS